MLKPVDDHIWLVTFMDDDLGQFDDGTCRLEPIENRPETVTDVSGMDLPENVKPS